MAVNLLNWARKSRLPRFWRKFKYLSNGHIFFDISSFLGRAMRQKYQLTFLLLLLHLLPPTLVWHYCFGIHQEWALFQSLSNLTKNKQIVKVFLSPAKCSFRYQRSNSSFEFRFWVSLATEILKSRLYATICPPVISSPPPPPLSPYNPPTSRTYYCIMHIRWRLRTLLSAKTHHSAKWLSTKRGMTIKSCRAKEISIPSSEIQLSGFRQSVGRSGRSTCQNT